MVLQYSRIDREHVLIFLAKDITKKVNLVALAEGYSKQQ